MIGLIGGTGLGDALFGETFGREVEVETPFGAPSSKVRVLSWSGLELAVLSRHGEGHLLAPSEVPYRANVYALKSLGVTHLLVSGAVGSLRDELRPRDLVVVDQVIDKTYRRVPTFFDRGVAVHAELAEPYCPALRARLVAAASGARATLGDATVHAQGTYVCMEGPAFSTVAEAKMHRAWGGDLIGMTAMPEAKLAREAEMCCALVAFPTDYDCFRPQPPGQTREGLLEEILGNLKVATANAVALLRATIASLAEAPLGACACRSALALGIWSDRSKIAPADIARYGPLVSKYLP